MSSITRQALSKPQLGCGAQARPSLRPAPAAIPLRRCIAVAALTPTPTPTSTTPSSPVCRAASPSPDQHSSPSASKIEPENVLGLETTLPMSFAAAALFWLATAPAAFAADGETAASAAVDFSKGGFAKESYYVTLGLFLLSLPGLWSQIKRAPKAKRVRRVYEVPGPAAPGAMPLDERARQIFRYFKQYNYTVAKPGSSSSASSSSSSSSGDDGPSTSSSSSSAPSSADQSTDVIRFVGRYAASRGQAAALVFYVFCGLASTALVLSIAAPIAGHGEWWYALTALSPLAGLYYWQRGERDEEFLVKMTTADDDSVTDIAVEGDAEEADRMAKTLGLNEKGKVYVKGILG